LALPLPDGSAAGKVVIDRVLDWYVEDGFTLQEKGIGQMSVELQTPLPGIVEAARRPLDGETHQVHA
jgi:hypothetical protein